MPRTIDITPRPNSRVLAQIGLYPFSTSKAAEIIGCFYNSPSMLPAAEFPAPHPSPGVLLILFLILGASVWVFAMLVRRETRHRRLVSMASGPGRTTCNFAGVAAIPRRFPRARAIRSQDSPLHPRPRNHARPDRNRRRRANHRRLQTSMERDAVRPENSLAPQRPSPRPPARSASSISFRFPAIPP